MSTVTIKNEVLSTLNYGLFKLMRGNRVVNDTQVNRLVASMKRKYIPVPIIVNGKYEIIDGQHRLAACRVLGLPIYYIKGENYDLNDVQQINSASKNWTPIDHAQSYATLGNKDYQTYLDFVEEYGFEKKIAVAMLAGQISEQRGVHSDFKNGLFKVKSLAYAKSCADKLYQIAPFYKGFKRRSFAIAMMHLFQNKQYNHKQFLEKLQYNSQKMVDCTSYDQYIHLIEGIYNWRSQDKVRFF